MIRIENLSKHYNGLHALKGISLKVEEGELFAYLGPNGAGKTTTIRILNGLTVPSSGTALLNGFDIGKDRLKARTQSGLVPQAVNLDQELTVYENLDIHGRLFHMPAKERKTRILELLEYVELKEKISSPVKYLSGGMKRRLVIARALVHSPKILFLDEPTVGLDAAIRRRIWALIKKIQQAGATIFLTTHYIEEAEFLADRVAFLNEGKIVAIDSPQVLMSKKGNWAIDRFEADNINTVYFRTRDEAKGYIASQNESFTLRRVNLEDSFLDLTGKKVK